MSMEFDQAVSVAARFCPAALARLACFDPVIAIALLSLINRFGMALFL